MLVTTPHRVLTPLPEFDPGAGIVVKSPERPEPGYWIGCPGVLRIGEKFLLTYRERHPRGVVPERGWRCAIAESTDGVTFTDVWAVTKDVLHSPSMERFSLLPGPDGFQLYFSYVDPEDNRWRIDVAEAASVDAFDVLTAKPLLTAKNTGTEGIKDPYAMRLGPTAYVFASYAERGEFSASDAHGSADIYNVGVTTHPTGLATIVDGQLTKWLPGALPVGSTWDRYQTRLNSIVPLGGAYVGCYDGSADASENYEERCGLAFSTDLINWTSLTPDEPWIHSGHATGSVRYVDALIVDGAWWLYYEMTRPDGAHELRLYRQPV